MITFDAGLKDVDKLLFSPDGTILAIREDGTHLLNSQTFDAIARYPGRGEMAFTPDSLSLAFEQYEGIDVHTPGKVNLKLQDTASRQSMWDNLRFSHDGKHLEAGGIQTKGFARWDATTGDLLHDSCAVFGTYAGSSEEIDGTVEGMTYTISTGRTLTLFSTRAAGKKPKCEAVVYAGAVKQGTIRIDNKGGLPRPILISSDGRYLVAPWWRVIGIWNLETLSQTARINVDHKPFLDAALTPDGRQLLTVTNNDTHVRFWDLASGELMAKYDWGIGKLTAVAVAPDGLRIACANAQGQVVIWDAK